MKVEDAATALLADPPGFLAKNALTLAGGSTLSSDLRIWYLSKAGNPLASVAMSGTDPSGTAWTGTRKIEAWRASVTSDTSDRVLKTYKLGTEDVAEFRAWYVAMRQVGEATATTHFFLPGTGGPDLMLTSQLTGCTFGFGSQSPGSGVLASHIQPPKAATGLGANDLRNAVAGPLGADATLIETTGLVKVSVIGHRVGGVWRFYKQVVDAMSNRITVTAQGV